ncbi:hypothetical protein AXF42_Ash017489 [Apostasia shenzhenica]|uniref:Bifunctional inhibitor/plant lipid transfer protein/seed storage helical domain-containing protein n=1 Tax=Apostasia shenzhenica TaxID=1088818 RepID=A0A2H9ZZ62_9ASPA|nr:hypothetical protein AXF42_Ash017489 [Apostasia shenzhenica]
MGIPATRICLLSVLAVLAAVSELAGSVGGSGECGRVPAQRLALRLAPCASAALNARAPVPASCCGEVRKLGRNPRCLCAVMLSSTARSAGVRPAVAMTIPKRCRLARRPVGYKCGGDAPLFN